MVAARIGGTLVAEGGGGLEHLDPDVMVISRLTSRSRCSSPLWAIGISGGYSARIGGTVVAEGGDVDLEHGGRGIVIVIFRSVDVPVVLHQLYGRSGFPVAMLREFGIGGTVVDAGGGDLVGEF